ncbi:MAG: GAF domain-containing protein [Desulfomonile tiedjei]|uniref:GAF domain-containing protein n=1 Tax=Desulfomonile tiedjei TaxID=2358 RepID=A0A9D6V2E0_9BACT|nr:GAF domain-containing protein [Desulfomonile tiedjei]
MESIFKEYPFRCFLSLKPLVDFWTKMLESSNGGRPHFAAGLKEYLDAVPELSHPVEDPAVLSPHSDVIKTLMTAVFPPAFWDTDTVAAVVPFLARPVLLSPLFESLIMNKDGSFRGRQSPEGTSPMLNRVRRAYYLILSKCYGIQEGWVDPTVQVVTDPKTGLDRYFRLKPDYRFVEVNNLGGPSVLSEDQRARLLDHLAEPEVLREILPPENFEFRGFAVLRAADVTETEVLTAIERDLVGKDSILSPVGFEHLNDRLRILFGITDLSSGLAAVRGNQTYLLGGSCEVSHNCIFGDSRHVPISEFKGSFFERAFQQRAILRVRDLREKDIRTHVDSEMLKEGFRSLLIAPLFYQGELIGTLKLASKHPDRFGATQSAIAEQIIPLFSMALKRSLDMLETKVQTIIKEKCTAIHPSVEWRFKKAVFDHLERMHSGDQSELEPIVFRDVYPLFGACDIRGSSGTRNNAMQADLSEHLELARAVVETAAAERSLPMSFELSHRLHGHLERIRKGISTGDERLITDFIQSEIEPLFPILSTFGDSVQQAVNQYRISVDGERGSVYRGRNEFGESMALFNERIAGYLDREQAKAQAEFPHYFDRHKTDGIEYVIYLGASMVQNGHFSEFYVKSLRLWQIMVACGIAWHSEQLKSLVSVPFDSTHLILVSHDPISIRFRFDEKRFDVDGAYDTSHEIVRSRIDKAMVRGRDERLTQPGKIALVYSRIEEWRELQRHIDFLQGLGYLTREVESLELDDLPGVMGLKALRVTVDLESETLARNATQGGIDLESLT